MSFEHLREVLVTRHGALPPQLKLISQFVLDQPQQAALMRISDIGAHLGVQPSAVIRFSKAVGFAGFSDIQRILRAELAETFPSSYFERLQDSHGGPAQGTLARFADLARLSLSNLPETPAFDQAVDMLCSAETIHILGLRRAFGVSSYFAYLLSSFEARVNQIEFLGHMNQASLSTVRGGDLVFVISFPTYSVEVMEAMNVATDRGAKTIALTDSNVSPVAQGADLVLLTDQATDGGFRSAAGSMVTVQALAMAFGERAASKETERAR